MNKKNMNDDININEEIDSEKAIKAGAQRLSNMRSEASAHHPPAQPATAAAISLKGAIHYGRQII